jgi:D-alanine-D-alanine ligase
MNITVLHSVPTKRARNTLYALTDEDTGKSAILVAKALKKLRHNVILKGVDEGSLSSIRHIKADCIFNLIEWTGHDLPFALQSFQFLEETGIPFTGVGTEGYENTTNKIRMKQIFNDFGIPTPEWQVIYSARDSVKKQFRYPVIMKPAYEHCSIGIQFEAIATSLKMLRNKLPYAIAQFRQPILIEEFIRGDEYHVPVVEYQSSLGILCPARIIFQKKLKYPLLTFYGRWAPGHPEFASSSIAKSDLPDYKLQEISRVCLKAFSLCRLNDYARIDLRLHHGEPYLLEINSNPGLDSDPEYEFMFSCMQSDVSFTKLIDTILRSALCRYGVL